jgi:hypothetical protein
VGCRYYAGFYQLKPDALLEWRYLLAESHPLADRRTLLRAVEETVSVPASWEAPLLPIAAVCGMFPLPNAVWSTGCTAISLWYFGHYAYAMPLGSALGLLGSIPLHYAFGRIRRTAAELCGFEVRFCPAPCIPWTCTSAQRSLTEFRQCSL